MELEVHPLVKGIYPPMSADDFRALCRSIKANGLREPITLYEGKILDGDHRHQACQIENVEPKFTTYDGPEPLKLVADLNSHRRHLSVADRKAAAARLLKVDPTITDSELARKAGLGSHHTAAAVRAETAKPTNWQNANKEDEPTDDVRPLRFSTDPPPSAEPRKEASGRKARGRKPGTTVAKEVKPKSVTPQPREEWLFAGSALFEADPQQHGDDLVSIFVTCSGLLRETVEESKRQEWLEKIAVALGFRFTQPADA